MAIPEVLMSNRLRCFIAIEIPQAIKDELFTLQNELKKSNADIKFVEPENLHITLKFLGSVTPDKAEEIKASLLRTPFLTAPFASSLGKIGAFPGIGHPRVIWAGINKNKEKILRIYEAIEEMLSGLGFEKDTKPFETHITLGRVRSPKNLNNLKEALGNLNFISKEDFVIGSVTLFKSDLSKSGPVYTKIFEANFKTT